MPTLPQAQALRRAIDAAERPWRHANIDYGWCTADVARYVLRVIRRVRLVREPRSREPRNVDPP